MAAALVVGLSRSGLIAAGGGARRRSGCCRAARMRAARPRAGCWPASAPSRSLRSPTRTRTRSRPGSSETIKLGLGGRSAIWRETLADDQGLLADRRRPRRVRARDDRLPAVAARRVLQPRAQRVSADAAEGGVLLAHAGARHRRSPARGAFAGASAPIGRRSTGCARAPSAVSSPSRSRASGKPAARAGQRRCCSPCSRRSRCTITGSSADLQVRRFRQA